MIGSVSHGKLVTECFGLHQSDFQVHTLSVKLPWVKIKGSFGADFSCIPPHIEVFVWITFRVPLRVFVKDYLVSHFTMTR